MEREQFKIKVHELMPGLVDSVETECKKLFDSGGVDTLTYDDDFALPKIILTVALENIRSQYLPLSSSYNKDIDNLRKF